MKGITLWIGARKNGIVIALVTAMWGLFVLIYAGLEGGNDSYVAAGMGAMGVLMAIGALIL
jgi:hypothetical protein